MNDFSSGLSADIQGFAPPGVDFQALDARAVDPRGIEQARTEFGMAHYHRHNRRRQEHLASLGLDLRNKQVLEIGAGVGDHTSFFLDRGCSVVSTEPRPENCAVFRQNMKDLVDGGYRTAGSLRLIQTDVESLDRTVPARFDIVYCYGVLYHLGDPEAALAILARRSAGLLLLETCVSFGSQFAIWMTPERKESTTQAFHGKGNRPTRRWIFTELQKHFPHVYMPRTQPAHEEFPLHWPDKRPADRKVHWSRAVFVASRRKLDAPLLLDHVPRDQTTG